MSIARICPHAIYYELHGGGLGLPAVLVMGLAIDAHGWEKQLPALSQDRPVLVLDNRGVGRSDKPKGPYAVRELALDVLGVMDAAGFERAHVAGLSLGGMIAQELALEAPSRVASLALLATYGAAVGIRDVADAGSRRAGGGRGLAAMLAAVASGEVEIDFKQALAFLAPLSLSERFMQENAAFLQSFFERSMGYGLSSDGLAGQVAAAIAHNATARLSAIACPTLVVGAERDRLTPVAQARSLASAIAGARYVEFPGAAHALNWEHPRELSELLSGWFSEHDPAS